MDLSQILNSNYLNDYDYVFGTDKETVHSYVSGFYEEAFKPYKEKATAVLEIGIFRGASIKLWREFFINAVIYGVDITDLVLPRFKNLRDTRLIFEDAYSDQFMNDNEKFDIIIDDGPHTLESQVRFIQKYHDKMNENSIMVIEDILDISYVDHFKNEISKIPKNLICEIIDLRKKKNRYDDLLFVIRN